MVSLKLLLLTVCLVKLLSNYLVYGNNLLYRELGCTSILTENSDAGAYDCGNFETRSADKCYFYGKAYDLNQELSDADSITIPCYAACKCRSTSFKGENVASFRCANVECPSLFNRRPAEPCYYQYEKDNCCEVKTYCPETKSTVYQCEYDNIMYKEGEKIYINNNICICKPGFNGTINNDWCREIRCNNEINNIKSIIAKGAPVYFKTSEGCPIEWLNPENIPGTAGKFASAGKSQIVQKCKYGSLELLVGQELEIGDLSDSESYKTTCSCEIPPFITCLKQIKS
ncbi:uncharacterized protein LOC126903121 [Daktulosphaira vitifoliae]|uniref:uncharacterized protein LOC126903121 n=1 Tax=Daktulosphaira vitifoliae TaxID=58002 RepID=UPI0021AA6CFE|nr:uncharacterized protein LOC126903121 [Daktulosphaira vitifoliae]